MLAHAQTLRNLHYAIASLNNLSHRVPIEFFAELAFEHLSIPAPNLAKETSIILDYSGIVIRLTYAKIVH